MKLPLFEIATVDQEKVVGYLMNPSHRYGASKSRFFAEFGFSRNNWQALARALQGHAATHEVARLRQTPFGTRYEIDGTLASPDGRNPRVRTIWQWDGKSPAPRLITAHPLEAVTS
ncbi:MAG: hypothetical protein K1X53_07870 [Candidatus Sumerlaeaceae bacterium]|nr:hypothetical protein [Candidatus Sumerlaeaceae bacterium]